MLAEASARATFDEVELLDQCDGSVELVSDVLDLFRQDYPRHVQALRQGAASSDPDRIVRAAHSLKGGLATLAAGSARDLAGAIEAAAEANELEHIDELLLRLDHELERLIVELKAYQDRRIAA